MDNHPAGRSLTSTLQRLFGTDGESILTNVLRGGGVGGYDELFVARRSRDGVDETTLIVGVDVCKESFLDTVPSDEEGVTGVGVDVAELARFECGYLVAVLAVVPVEVHAVGRLVVEFDVEFFVWANVVDVDFAGGGDGGLVGRGCRWEKEEERGEEQEQVHFQEGGSWLLVAQEPRARAYL